MKLIYLLILFLFDINRMLEFEDTPSSNLTVDEFHTIDLEEEHDPPAYTRSRKFAKIKQIEEMTNIQEIEKEIIQLQENIEAALNELNRPRVKQKL